MPEKPSKISTDPYKGVRDFYPEDWSSEKYIFDIWKKTVEKFGYVEYNASPLESSELYEAKSGEEMVNEQTYKFNDRGERSVTLRPEMTPTVARMVAAKRRELPFPLRWYSIPNLFRYERPQRGRLREHYQLNVDLFGIDSLEADLEILILADRIMKNFGAKDSDFEIRLSSRKLLNAVFNNWYELDPEQSNALRRLIDKKGKIAEADFQQKAEEITGKAFKFLDFAKSSSEYQEALAFPKIRAAKEELDIAIDTLKSRGVHNVRIDSELVRGFDYYTGIVFEVFDTNVENNRSLFGGGRYDDLLSVFEGEKVPAVGFGMGDVTILNFLETRNLLPKYQSTCQIIFFALEQQFADRAFELAEKWRKAGFNCSSDNTFRKIGDQIKKAEKLGVQQVAFIGADEIKSGGYKTKNLITGEERSFEESSPLTF